jgi:hypothetical protein
MEKAAVGKKLPWRPERPWNRVRVPLAIVLSMGYAFSLYLFFQTIREIIRMVGSPYGSNIFVFLEPREVFLYNLFFASISGVLGLSVGIKFLMENSSFRQPIKWKVRQRHIITEMRFMHWGFLFIFGKVLSVFAIFYMMFMFQYDINFLKEFPIIFLCLPLVLFLQLWTQINLVLRKKGLIYMGVAFLAVAIFSVVLALKNYPDYKGNDKVLREASIEKYFPLQTPESQHTTISYGVGPAKIAVQYHADTIGKIITYLYNNKSLSQEEFIKKWEDYTHMFDDEGVAVIPLYADAEISYKTIKSIREKITEKLPVSFYYYAKSPKSKYPAFYHYSTFYGFVRREPRIYPEMDTLLQEVFQMGAKSRLLLPESDAYRNRYVRGLNRVEVKITESKLLLNNQEIREAELEEFIYEFIQRYSPNYCISYDPSSDITYGRYLHGLELLMQPLDRVRQEFACQEFGNKAEKLLREYPSPKQKVVVQTYPDRVVEWTSQEMVIEHLIRTHRARLIR